jgi:hypothetical protein
LARIFLWMNCLGCETLTGVLAELHPHEFHARMGVSVEESQQMRNTLDELTRQMRFVKTA